MRLRAIGLRRRLHSNGPSAVIQAPSLNRPFPAIANAGGQALAVKTDVSKTCAAPVQRGARLGPLDILVANSGMQKDAAFRNMSLHDWQQVIDVTLTGAFLRARSRETLQHAGASPIERAGQDHFHEFGARAHSLGRARELRRFQGRHADADEEPGAGG